MSPSDRLVESWDGRDYERHSSHQRAWGSDLIAGLSLRGDEQVLDLGCGDGSLTRQMAERVPRGSVLGIDAAAEMLDAARDKCGPNMAVQHLEGWIDNPCLIPFVQALPAELRKPFRDAVVEAMLARTRQPDATYLEPFRRMNVWARRAE